MSPKPRNPENRDLPARWRKKHGAYYYRPPASCQNMWDGKTEFRLGKTLHEAYRTWADRTEAYDEARSMAQLLDRYALEVVHTKAFKSQQSNQISIRRLRPVFGDMPIATIKPRHVYLYRDKVTKANGPASANRDLEVLSHALSKATEWGLIDRNPIKGQVRKNKIPRRERYIEDWELDEAMKVANPVLQNYIILKLLTGLRRGDLLQLKTTDLREDGIRANTGKTGKRLIIEWTEELREAISSALAVRPKEDTELIFCTRYGDCYVKDNGTANGFDSLWRRFMTKLIAETKVTERFQEKDLRKKTATDMNVDQARRLLGHTSERTTHQHYRLKGEIVKPHSLKK